MSLRQIGPVALEAVTWGLPRAAWTSQPTASGVRGVSIEGVVNWVQAQQLSELVDNPDRVVTIGGQSGVLEYLLFDDELLRPFTGWCLLQSFNLGAEQQWSLAGVGGPVGFSISGAHIGEDREVVIVRTGRARANDFGLTPVSVAAEPLYTESGSAEASAPSSTDILGGHPSNVRLLSRLYDRRAWANTTEVATSVKRLYLSDLGAAQDRTTILVGRRANNGSVAPWARYRGGDVRAYDRSEDREVYGPSHPFKATSDLGLTNGLLRFWVGARGLIPYLHVSVWSVDRWREMGSIVLGTAPLYAARLVRCTPDVATVALSIASMGDIFVTLRRGHRHLSIAHGTGRPPLFTVPRRAEWRGTPPGSLTNVATAAARFGNGLSLNAGGSITFDWPPSALVERWSIAGRTKMDAASTAKGDQRLASILAGGGQVGSLSFRASDDTLVLVLGAQTLVSTPVTFSSGQSLGWVVRFSTTEGLALSWNVAEGPVSHVSSAVFTDPGATSAAYQFLGLLGPAGVGGGGPGPGAGVLVNDPVVLVNDTAALVNNT